MLLGLLADAMGREDLAGVDVLDVGCGTKFSEAIVNDGLAVGSYHGADVNREVIEHLRTHNADPRFSYHHVGVRNELYNPDAPEMGVDTDLGCGDRTFDLICLFSVFTHLAPTDYAVMLRLLRRYVRPDGMLFFTVFLDELTEGGHSFPDIIDRRMGGPESGLSIAERQSARTVVPFHDADPSRPLTYAIYAREYAMALIDGTGWEVVEVRDPIREAQHQVVCRPA
ncbi:MAG: class I SAM-dependent methyltransferase [Nocardioidaceae bacterium]|nr:class I SAM-dependent methyltransferase [Nocardioidaceae bacterium]